MLMNVLASGFLFLFIGPFKHVSSGKTKAAGQVKVQQDVYIAVNNTLELNCYISRTIHDIYPIQLAWKHDNKWIRNFTAHTVNNNTCLQLRRNKTGYEDAGVYKCGFFNNSKFQSTQSVRVLVGEKPLVASVDQINFKVYGSPVQEVHLEWPAQANVTNEVFVGRIPAGINYFPCKFRNASDCKQTAVLDQNKNLSCQIGMDVLRKLFQWIELNGKCSTNSSLVRCDTFCVKIIARNAFGTSESGPALQNLKHAALCPALRNLRVSLNGDNITVSWKRPYLVQENVSYNYDVTYVITPILTGEPSRPKSVDGSTTNCNECVSINEPIVPYARYSFTATCNFYDNKEAGPAVYAEVMSKEAAPSELSYSCEVKNRSRHDAFLSWKIPAIDTWNGIPRKFLVQYENHVVVVNTSLDEPQARYNRSTATQAALTMLTNLDPHKKYSVIVAMCTGAGCRNFSKSCNIPVAFPGGDYNEKVPVSPDTTNNTGVATWITIAFGLITGISLAVFIGYLMWRKRTRRKQQAPLFSVLGPLDGPHPYENDSDDRPSFIEEDLNYDTICTKECRPLLNNMDCTVGNFPVTDI